MINSTMNNINLVGEVKQFTGDATHDVCHKCNGRGSIAHFLHVESGICFTCNGTGKVAKKVTNKGGVTMLKNNSIQFKLNAGEIIRQIRYTKDSMMVSRIATFSYLKVLDYEGLLPRGYLTRVKNGHISYHTCILMCRRKSQDSAYRLATAKYGEYTLIGLVEKATPQPEPTPEQLIKVIDLTEDNDNPCADCEQNHSSDPDCTECNAYGDEYQDDDADIHNYTICPSCKREVYNDTFMQNVGECEGCHFIGPEWVLENVADDDADIPTNDENAMWAKIVVDMKSNR